MSASATSGTSATSISGYKVAAGARVGSNGQEDGDWEYFVRGTSGSSIMTGRRVWDQDPGDEINSSTVVTQLAAQPGGGSGGVAWTVTGGETVPLSYSSASYGAISSVKIRALASFPGCLFEWTSVSVKFYKNGALVETIPYESIIADTREQSNPREEIVTFTPTNADNTKVVVEATMQLIYGGADIESPDAVSGQVYIFAA